MTNKEVTKLLIYLKSKGYSYSNRNYTTMNPATRDPIYHYMIDVFNLAEFRGISSRGKCDAMKIAVLKLKDYLYCNGLPDKTKNYYRKANLTNVKFNQDENFDYSQGPALDIQNNNNNRFVDKSISDDQSFPVNFIKQPMPNEDEDELKFFNPTIKDFRRFSMVNTFILGKLQYFSYSIQLLAFYRLF